mgnify:CR=1 FL=1
MHCCVFGIANHSPDEVVAALLKYRLASKASDIGILPPMSKADTRYKFLLILSTSDLSRNLARLDNSQVKVFVFSNPVDLMDFPGIRNLDFVPVDDFTFNFTQLDLSKVSKSAPVKVQRSQSHFLLKLIDSVKHGSLLNPLMTFIYSLSSANQNVIKRLAVSSLYYGYAEKRIRAEAAEYLTDRATDRLLAILSTSIGLSYATALRKVKALRSKRAKFDLSAISTETSTSAYELSYLLSVFDSKKDTFTDSFDMAKNRKAQTNKVRK